MSLAIAIRDSRLFTYNDYEPVNDFSKVLSSKWDQERNYLKGSALDWFPTVDAETIGVKSQIKKSNRGQV